MEFLEEMLHFSLKISLFSYQHFHPIFLWRGKIIFIPVLVITAYNAKELSRDQSLLSRNPNSQVLSMKLTKIIFQQCKLTADRFRPHLLYNIVHTLFYILQYLNG